MTNYYKVIGVSEKAPIIEIKAKIAELLIEEGPESHQVLKAIYDLLTDPVKKAAYDRRLLEARKKQYVVPVEQNIPICVYGPPPFRK